MPRISEPTAAMLAMSRLADSEVISVLSWKKSEYQRVLKPWKVDERLHAVEAEQHDGEDRQVEPGEEQHGDGHGERRSLFEPAAPVPAALFGGAERGEKTGV